MTNSFQCANCGGTFETSRSEAEAIADRERDFPEFEQSDCCVICDDCYVKFNAWLEATRVPQHH